MLLPKKVQHIRMLYSFSVIEYDFNSKYMVLETAQLYCKDLLYVYNLKPGSIFDFHLKYASECLRIIYSEV